MIINQPQIQEKQIKKLDLKKYSLKELESILPDFIQKDGLIYYLFYDKLQFTDTNIVKYSYNLDGAGYFLTRGNTLKQAIQNMINELYNANIIKIN